jgi:hypothetical protein
VKDAGSRAGDLEAGATTRTSQEAR